MGKGLQSLAPGYLPGWPEASRRRWWAAWHPYGSWRCWCSLAYKVDGFEGSSGSWLGGVEELRELRFRHRLALRFPHPLGNPPAHPLDLLVHLRQDGDHRLAPGVVDRFCLGAFHAKEFAGQRSCPLPD